MFLPRPSIGMEMGSLEVDLDKPLPLIEIREATG